MTRMAEEIRTIPDIAAAQIAEGLPLYAETGRRLAALAPPTLVTCARGSSDHAAHYLKYLVELRLGLPVCSMGPSIASVYDTQMRLQNIPVLALSQSGGSSDLSAFMKRASDCGAETIALTNDTASLLAGSVQTVLPMLAGPEQAVAATKTFVTSLIAAAALTAAWAGDDEMTEALHRLPDALRAAVDSDWSAALDRFSGQTQLFVISRGPSFAIAGEMALKFKETCLIHAEVFSAAEVRHGPMALIDPGFAALIVQTRDAGQTSIDEAAKAMEEAGAQLLRIGAPQSGANLTVPTAPHPLLDPICQIAGFYGFVEQLSRRLGHNPDAPRLLKKVTVTL